MFGKCGDPLFFDPLPRVQRVLGFGHVADPRQLSKGPFAPTVQDIPVVGQEPDGGDVYEQVRRLLVESLRLGIQVELELQGGQAGVLDVTDAHVCRIQRHRVVIHQAGVHRQEIASLLEVLQFLRDLVVIVVPVVGPLAGPQVVRPFPDLGREQVELDLAAGPDPVGGASD